MTDTAPDLTPHLGELADLPVPVARWEFERGEDSTGNDALWIWAYLDGTFEQRQDRSVQRERIRDWSYRHADPPVQWTYVHFRDVHEEVPT